MLDKIIGAISLAGSATPAFRELFDLAVAMLKPADQEAAQSAYEKAMGRSDAAHAAVQGAR